MSLKNVQGLVSFVESATGGSFTAAASRLGVTPAAVGKNVARLEGELGVRLFNRTTRRLSLTDEGKAFLAEAGDALRRLEDAVDNVTLAATEPSGRVRISCSTSFGRRFVLPLLSDIARRHPKLDLELVLDNRIVDMLAEGFDIAVRGGTLGDSSLVAKHVCRLYSVLVASPAYLRRHGVPASPADLDRIFAPFTQVDASDTREHGGIGLGLTIASELIQALGGSHTVRSAPGQGSVFSFTMPLLHEARHSARRTSKVTLDESEAVTSDSTDGDRPPPSLQVLLAEDTPTNQLLVVHALEKRGHRVQVASDGRMAVEFASRCQFDVILMDLQMPAMDGFQATAAIRALPGRSHVPIVALTAHAMVGDRERCLAAGMDGYLSKPLNLHELVDVVEGAALPAAAHQRYVDS